MADYQTIFTYIRHFFEIAEYVVIKLLLLILAIIGAVALIRQHG